MPTPPPRQDSHKPHRRAVTLLEVEQEVRREVDALRRECEDAGYKFPERHPKRAAFHRAAGQLAGLDLAGIMVPLAVEHLAVHYDVMLPRRVRHRVGRPRRVQNLCAGLEAAARELGRMGFLSEMRAMRELVPPLSAIYFPGLYGAAVPGGPTVAPGQEPGAS